MVRPLNCIVAVSQNMGIGKNGDLPWPPLRNEFKYFQRMTTTPSVQGKQNLVIMGRKTWFSIPEKNRPLKDRINIVLSRELKELPQGAHFLANSLNDALKLTEQPELASKIDMVWIVGGSSVYKEAMNQPGHIKLFVTRIMQEFESDTFFPEIDLKKYKLLPEPRNGVTPQIQGHSQCDWLKQLLLTPTGTNWGAASMIRRKYTKIWSDVEMFTGGRMVRAVFSQQPGF